MGNVEAGPQGKLADNTQGCGRGTSGKHWNGPGRVGSSEPRLARQGFRREPLETPAREPEVRHTLAAISPIRRKARPQPGLMTS
jgi:hypothetical protein